MRILLSVLLLLGSVSIAKAYQLFGITLHENIFKLCK